MSGELADLILDECVEVAAVPGEAFGPSGLCASPTPCPTTTSSKVSPAYREFFSPDG